LLQFRVRKRRLRCNHRMHQWRRNGCRRGSGRCRR
jgi:hypothetical protein